ncbi:MAG: alpha-galactosidase [Clostridia bacterium]|nr:alpha-galactosidase [Clostridia bacterium]
MQTKRYKFGDTVVIYIIDDEDKVIMHLVPEKKEIKLAKSWELPNITEVNPRADFSRQWVTGSIAQVHLSHHHSGPANGNTLKLAENLERLKFISQSLEESENNCIVITIMRSDEGYSVTHTLEYRKGFDAFKVKTEFKNESDRNFCVELLSSFSLDNLSPFSEGDMTGKIKLHRFHGGWSLEGRHNVSTIEQLGLEKPWLHCFRPNEKFGSIGSHPTTKYFPTAAVEDSEQGVFWAASLAHNGSWQMELTRLSDTLSFSGGYADAEFGSWFKNVSPGEKLVSPEAYISTSDIDLEDACSRITQLYNIPCDAYGEAELFAVQYNEYCTSWGFPTQEKMLTYAEALKNRGIKYMVIDAGWSEGCYNAQQGNGIWEIDKKIFPDMKALCDQIRALGMVPGIWFDFECVTLKCPLYDTHEDLFLKKHGIVINCAGWRKFWDLRKPEVINHLTEHVIGLLKVCGFGYLKVDYNGSIGIGCDGDDSLGAGLNSHLSAVCDFFRKIKQEIPDIVIENCASGGHRAEPLMMGLTGVTSATDAHECKEIPYIAANLHNLMLPRQELLWSVLHNDDTTEREIYSLCGAFFGRLCMSGDITELTDEQWEIFENGIDYYNKLHNILMKGTTRIYGNRSASMRHAEGTQVAVRQGKDEILVIAHAFKNPCKTEICIPIPSGYSVAAEFYNTVISKNGNTLKVRPMSQYTATSIYLKKLEIDG